MYNFIAVSAAHSVAATSHSSNTSNTSNTNHSSDSISNTDNSFSNDTSNDNSYGGLGIGGLIGVIIGGTFFISSCISFGYTYFDKK
jgi:hypothetical protein